MYISCFVTIKYLNIVVLFYVYLAEPISSASTTAFIELSSTTTILPDSVPPQCISYTMITDKTRHVSHPHYIWCDNAVFKSEPMWVRFSGAAGTRLTSGPMEPFHCGTQGTGWYNGIYPTSVGATTPEQTRAGDALFSWSWVAVTGNRNEYFQNCASIRIDGSGTSTLDDFPDMFVGDMSLTGHIGPGECRSTAGFSLEYPNPGRTLTSTKVDRISYKKPTNGKCYAKASRASSTQVIPLSPVTTSGSSNGASPSSTVDVNSERPTVSETAPTLSTKQSPTENVESTLPTETMLPGSKSHQCSNYTTITDKTRHVSHPDYITCDNAVFKTKPIWVRFSGAAGTRLAPGPVEPFHCGTQGTGWYKGTYPTSIGDTTSGTVCYSWPRNSCQWSNQISVTNCGGYYVFQLRAPPACFLRYCTI
ncbi:unnamed protein product [Rotaria socialis]